jgi:hypothetical protein
MRPEAVQRFELGGELRGEGIEARPARRHVEPLHADQCTVIVERRVARVALQPPHGRLHGDDVLIERISLVEGRRDVAGVSQPAGREQRLADDDLGAGAGGREARGALRERQRARWLAQVGAQVGRLPQQRDVVGDHRQSGRRRRERRRRVAGEFQHDRLDPVEAGCARRASNRRVEALQRRLDPPGAHPSQLGEVAVGVDVRRSKRERLLEHPLGLVEPALAEQRAREHESRLGRRDAERQRAAGRVLRFARMTDVAFGRRQVVPRDAIVGTGRQRPPHQRDVGRAVVQHLPTATGRLARGAKTMCIVSARSRTSAPASAPLRCSSRCSAGR